jgi:hypothetical protein
MLDIGGHLYVGLRSVIEDAHWSKVLVAALDRV